MIVTGTLSGKPVTYRAAVAGFAGRQESGVRSQESGARMTRLRLFRGCGRGCIWMNCWRRVRRRRFRTRSSALSEEFHIITPYTSLLVLESDADRERFKVKKRMLIRDGERFFAAGTRRRAVRASPAADAGRRPVAGRPAAASAGAVGHARPRCAACPCRDRGRKLCGSAADFRNLLGLIDSTIAPATWDEPRRSRRHRRDSRAT